MLMIAAIFFSLPHQIEEYTFNPHGCLHDFPHPPYSGTLFLTLYGCLKSEAIGQ
jgi:hypothetical protein